jgi:hypothetical protein
MFRNAKVDYKPFKGVFLYGCETWSFTKREERRRRVFENRLLRDVIGS